MPEADRDFYVGYESRAPAGVAGFVRRIVLVGLAAAPLLAFSLAALQSPFADSVFEFGNEREFEGRITSAPYPFLRVERPAAQESETHLLVATGKRGADQAVAGLDGHAVKLEGQRIFRGDSRMIELREAGIVDIGPREAGPVTERSLGEHVLAGEIVDSKCHLGVMKPGNGKTHRACAARCISGGSPPMLWVRDHGGEERQFLLVGRDGRRLGAELLDFVAEPVEVTGEVILHGDLRILRTEPVQIARVGLGRPESAPPEPHER